MAKQWSSAKHRNIVTNANDNAGKLLKQGINTDSIDNFLARVDTYTLSISGMAFQDAWTLELDRLRDCLIHVVSPQGRLIPFCAYNLTAKNGISIYRKVRG